MSILTKISILFAISISLMLYISNQTEKITSEKIELVQKEKYIQASKDLFGYIIDANFAKLQKQTKNIGYKQVDLSLLNSNLEIVYSSSISFGEIKIYKDKNIYFLYMKYFDDEFLLFDIAQEKDIEQKKELNYLIIADSMLLVIIFLILINMLRPLKNIAIAMEKFGKGNLALRLKKNSKTDEIAKVTNHFNIMAKNIETLIVSRSQLLSDISHELRTPIARAMLSLEMIEDSRYKDILKKSILQMDRLTNEILELEKLGSSTLKLDIDEYKIETILAEALSSMIIDEQYIEVIIEESFVCKVDLNYFSMAIKNLIDNALKYRKSDKVKIIVQNNSIAIYNRGDKLEKSLSYYLDTFTQDDNSRGKAGYGLGLNIVKRVVYKHRFELKYSYENGYNIFKVIL